MPSSKQDVWQTDPRGKLRLAGIHDGRLAEFSYVYREVARFVILGAGGETTSLRLEKPIVLSINELWEGSIVDGVDIWPVADAPLAASCDEDTGWNALLRDRVASEGRDVEAARLTKAHPNATLLVVSCSYGGAWAALCDRVVIAQDGAAPAQQ